MKTLLRIFASILVTYALLSLAGCDTKSNSAEETLSDVGATIDREREELAAELRELQRSIDRKSDMVEKKMERASGDAREKLENANQNLKREKREVDKALNEVEHATEETWSEVREGTLKTFQKVKQEFSEVANRIADLLKSDS